VGFALSLSVCACAGQIAYLMVDVAYKTDEDLQTLQEKMAAVPESILTRILYG
jgi:hypothetical protein